MSISVELLWSNDPLPINEIIENPTVVVNLPIGGTIITSNVTQSYVDDQDALLQTQIDTKADADAVNQSLSLKADLVGGVVPAAQLPSGVAGVALGETASTAYRGDRGKVAYDHSLSQGNPHNTTTSDIVEGTKLFFTESRVNQTVLTGLDTSTATPALATDQLLVAIGKLQAQISNSSSGSSGFNWVNVETIGTMYSAIDLHNLEAAKIDGMLFFRGWFRNSTAAIQTSNPILNITDTSYHVQHDDVDTFQTISTSSLYWGRASGTIRFTVNTTSGVQQIATTGVLNAANSHRKIGSGLWCAGVLKNP